MYFKSRRNDKKPAFEKKINYKKNCTKNYCSRQGKILLKI
jgi:hypothetical protein